MRLNLLLIFSIICVFTVNGNCEIIGNLTKVEGTVDITRKDKSIIFPKKGDAVFAGDIIRTKSNAIAELLFIDKSVIKIAPSSRIEVSNYFMNKKETNGIINLFRGKIQSIITKKAWSFFSRSRGKRFEIHTPTAVCGVRGTNFVTYFQKGISGSIFIEGEGYGYNKNQPDKISLIKAGQSMLVLSQTSIPLIRPVTSFEIEQHLKDINTSKAGSEELTKKNGKNDATRPKIQGHSGNIESENGGLFSKPGSMALTSLLTNKSDYGESIKEYSYSIDIAGFNREQNFFYDLRLDNKQNAGVFVYDKNLFIPLTFNTGIFQNDISKYVDDIWNLYVGNTSGYFFDGTSYGGNIYISPIVREDLHLQKTNWTISKILSTGFYVEFNNFIYDKWFIGIDYEENFLRNFIRYDGSKWSEGKIEAKGVSAWVNWHECYTGVGFGDVSGVYSPEDKKWLASERWVMMETNKFIQMAANEKNKLKELGIPFAEIGKTNLYGNGNNINVSLKDITFFAFKTGDNPLIWATNNVSGTFTDSPLTGVPISLSGEGISANFEIKTWQNNQWAAFITNGTGNIARIDNGNSIGVNFEGGSAGTYQINNGVFEGTASGVISLK
ncbi:MAG: FecR domain-containing protein [Desulfobacterales bacterium]|nr:FecR domain-containing protein [Desulfobacterales bacterium]